MKIMTKNAQYHKRYWNLYQNNLDIA